MDGLPKEVYYQTFYFETSDKTELFELTNLLILFWLMQKWLSFLTEV